MIGADSNGHVGEGNRGDENVMGMWWKAYPRGESGDRGRLQSLRQHDHWSLPRSPLSPLGYAFHHIPITFSSPLFPSPT